MLTFIKDFAVLSNSLVNFCDAPPQCFSEAKMPIQFGLGQEVVTVNDVIIRTDAVYPSKPLNEPHRVPV